MESSHRVVFSAVTDLIRKKRMPDMVLIAEEIEKQNGENWLPVLHEILSVTPVAANLTAYEEVIKRESRSAKQIIAAKQFAEETKRGEPGAVSRLQEKLRASERGSSRTKHVSDFYHEIVEKADAVAHGEVISGLPVGLEVLQKITDGWQQGDSIIIAARTSVGKTAFMCNLAVNTGAPCGIISAEQSGKQICNRVLARQTGVSGFRLKTGRLRPDEFGPLTDGAEGIANTPMFIDDTPRMTIDRVERSLQAMKWDHDIQSGFIDYLQLIQNPGIKEKRLQISDISSRCKALARELEIPIFTLAQLNRGADGKRPNLTHLKESGSIEEDADIVILLYPEDWDAEEPKSNKLIIDVAKNRDGPKRAFEVNWEPEYMRMRDL